MKLKLIALFILANTIGCSPLADHAHHVGKGLYCADVARINLIDAPETQDPVIWTCWHCKMSRDKIHLECRRTDRDVEYRTLGKLKDLQDEELFYLDIEELMAWQENHIIIKGE